MTSATYDASPLHIASCQIHSIALNRRKKALTEADEINRAVGKEDCSEIPF